MPAPLRQECERTPLWAASSPSVPLSHPTPPQASSGSTSSKTPCDLRQRISPLQRIRSRSGKAVAKSFVDNDTGEKGCSGNPARRTEQARGGRERGRSKNHHDARQRAKSMIRPPLSTKEDGYFFACPVCRTSKGETAPGKCHSLGMKMSPPSMIKIPPGIPVCNNAIMDGDCSAEFYPGNIQIPSVTNHAEGLLRGRTGRGQEDPMRRRARSEVRLGVRCEFKENLNVNNRFIVGRGRTSAFHEKNDILVAAPEAIAAYSEPKNLRRSSALDQKTEEGDCSGGRKRRRRRTNRNCGGPSRDRPKSKTRFPESKGVLTVWPRKTGIWLPM